MPDDDAPIQPSGAEPEHLVEENAELRAEVDALRASTSAAKLGRRHRMRGILTGVLVVLTSLSIVTATIGIWTQRTLSNTDRYVALVGPLADDPAVTNALAAKLTDEVFQALNVQGRVQEAIASIPNIPAQATFLAGPITSGAKDLVQGEVSDFLASEAFAFMWTDLNRQLHPKVQALLNGDYEELPNVEINGGDVQLNLVSAVAAIIQRLAQRGIDALGIDVTVPTIAPSLDASSAIQQLGSAVGVTLPADFGQITIMSARELKT